MTEQKTPKPSNRKAWRTENTSPAKAPKGRDPEGIYFIAVQSYLGVWDEDQESIIYAPSDKPAQHRVVLQQMLDTGQVVNVYPGYNGPTTNKN